MSLIHIIYVSTSTKDMTEDDILSILDVSRMRNQEDGITGMLIYRQGAFIQVIEGQAESVDSLMDRVMRDTRHTSISIIERCVIPVREFAEWSMGYHILTDDEAYSNPEFVDFLRGSYRSRIDYGPALVFLKSFANNSCI